MTRKVGNDPQVHDDGNAKKHKFYEKIIKFELV